MDQKAWMWRKKPSEKTVLATLEEEKSVVPSEKEVDLENSLKILNEELASIVDECSSKDEILQNYKKTSENALAEKERAEEEACRLKDELEKSNGRLVHLNSALKDCMDQLSAVRLDQDQMVRNAVMKTSSEFEKSRKKLEEKLSEIASLTAENSYLGKALVAKEKVIENLSIIKTQTEAEFEALMGRLDSVEKENAFLRYEFMSLEKELHVRNEEMECNRCSLEASNKQHLESVKKIKKLDVECQRLRTLMRKRLPGPAVFANVKNVVNGGDSADHHTNKQLNFLIDQIQDLQKENRIQKECLAQKEEEILSLKSRVKLEDGESTMMASEMRLMDDFVEMEKLAIVAVDSSSEKKPDNWLLVARNAVLEQHNVSKRSFDELLADVRVTLHGTEPSKLLPVSGYLTWKSPVSSPSSPLTQESSTDEMQSSDSVVRDEFRKHLGGDGPGTALELESVQNLMHQMEKMHSVFHEEIQGLKKELSSIKSSDEIENLKLVNEDLDTQLCVTRAKLNELVQRLSSVEVELDNKSHHCEELEATCLELQLQLESAATNRHLDENENKEEVLQTGLEITKASAKLAECEETILKLGKQLETLGSTKELSAVPEKMKQRSSLLDQMLCEDTADVESPKTKAPPAPYLGRNSDLLNAKTGALVLVPSKKQGRGGVGGGGISLLRKFLIRRKSKKTTSMYFAK